MLTSLLLSVAFAGGGPVNVVVLVNADDPEAVETAEYYRQARDLPDGHVCAIEGVDPHDDKIDFADFQDTISAGLDDCLEALPQPEEVDYLVVVRGLPYLVSLPEYVVSLQAILQVHHAEDATGEPIAGQAQDTSWGPAIASIANPRYVDGLCDDLNESNPSQEWYTTACGLVAMDKLPLTHQRQRAGSRDGVDFTGHLFGVSRLDGFDHQDARDLVDRAVAADGTFPTADLLCMAAADEARGARDPECEFLTRQLAQDGLPARWLSPFDGQLANQEVAALFTGTTSLQDGIDENIWVPGAVACNLTSYGAVPANFHCSADGLTCPENESQTSIARFVRAGATAAHGTAAEPLNNTFPNAGALLLYSAGYNLAESFLFSQRYLYWQNVLLGDPLVTPYATRPQVSVPAEAPQEGVLQIDARHPDGVASITLYLDGVLTQKTIGDQLSWTVEGAPGDVIEVLAIARSAHATIQRQGWPVSEQTLRPRVQGWTAARVTITDPIPTPPPPPVEPATPAAEPEGACGCNSSDSGAAGWIGVLALLARRRVSGARA